jgi:hypothetical protein
MTYSLSTFRKIILFALSLLVFPLYLHAAQEIDEDKTVITIFLDDIVVPLIVDKPKPDTTPPSKPRFVIAPPASTYEDHLYIEIGGEVDASIYINGKYSGKIGQSGTATLKLDTSGDNGVKTFNIVLRDSSGNNSSTLSVSITKTSDPKYDIEYKGLVFYSENMDPSGYKLTQLSDGKFNALTPEQKREVANTLLGTLFFGYPLHVLQEKIDKGNFLSQVREDLKEDVTDKAWLESYILDDTIFSQYNQWAEPQAITILSRFYAMKDLDKYFLNNWVAYILTQTIMFSPAYELESTHTPDIGNVYNRLVTFLNIDGGMRYITYIHMMSEENWRRFRSPEDNGREMLEIFLHDMEDSHVPIAAKALQNWKLNTDGDTLEVGLNENTEPLHLFGTIIVNGDDFYRELVKSTAFTEGVTKRLVDFFFPNAAATKKQQITSAIVSSRPETWQDILLQIIFSEEYLLRNKRAKSAEETFFSLTKKLEYLHRKSTFYYFKEALENMHQASMKYKLGKIERVPLDTLSFAYYHKYIREQVMLRRSYPDAIDNYASWGRQGWNKTFVTFDKFAHDEADIETSLENFIRYIFNATISRNPTSAELTLFKTHMIYEEDGEKYFHWAFNMFATYDDPERQERERENRKANIATLILDYISRLEETYTQKEVK